MVLRNFACISWDYTVFQTYPARFLVMVVCFRIFFKLYPYVVHRTKKKKNISREVFFLKIFQKGPYWRTLRGAPGVELPSRGVHLITLMLPSQKIKLLMENRETFLNQNKLAHLPLPHTRSPPENFTTKFMAQRGAMVECPSLLWLTTVRILTSSIQKTIKINTPLDRVECWFRRN